MNQPRACTECGMAASASAQWCADCGSTSIEAVPTTPPPANWAPPAGPAQQMPSHQWAAPQPPSGQWTGAGPYAGNPAASTFGQPAKAGAFAAIIALVWSIGTVLRAVLFYEGTAGPYTLGFHRLAHVGQLFNSPQYMRGKLNFEVFDYGFVLSPYTDPRTLIVAVLGILALVVVAARTQQLLDFLIAAVAIYLAGIWLLGLEPDFLSESIRHLFMMSVLPLGVIVVALIERGMTLDLRKQPGNIHHEEYW